MVDGVGQLGLAEAAVLTPQYTHTVWGPWGYWGGGGGKREQGSVAFPSKDRPPRSPGPPALGGRAPVGRGSPATRAVLPAR